MNRLSNESRVILALKNVYGFHDIYWGDALGGLSSHNIAFFADGVNYVVKEYGASAQQQLLRLDALAIFLQKNNFAAPVPIRAATGDLHFVFEKRFLAVFVRAKGRLLHQNDLTQKALKNTAIKLSQLHNLGLAAGNLLGKPKRPLFDAESSRPGIGALIKKMQLCSISPEHRHIIFESTKIKSLVLGKADLKSLQRMDMRNDFVHGDFQNENILYDFDDTPSCIMDYEESFLGHGVCDIMQFIQLGCCNTGFSSANLDKGQYFVSSYANISNLTAADTRLGLQHFFVAMASSLFFEEQLLAGQSFFVHLLQRDISKMKYYLAHANTLATAFTP